MRSIWKFEIAGGTTVVPMPKGARVLTVQMQGAQICLWAEVNTAAKVEERVFHAFGTGYKMPRCMGYSDVYVGTVQEGLFVWHVYEAERTGI